LSIFTTSVSGMCETEPGAHFPVCHDLLDRLNHDLLGYRITLIVNQGNPLITRITAPTHETQTP